MLIWWNIYSCPNISLHFFIIKAYFVLIECLARVTIFGVIHFFWSSFSLANKKPQMRTVHQSEASWCYSPGVSLWLVWSQFSHITRPRVNIYPGHISLNITLLILWLLALRALGNITHLHTHLTEMFIISLINVSKIHGWVMLLR